MADLSIDIKQKFNRDIMYEIVLRVYHGYSEYLLVSANDSDEVYAVLDESLIKE